jgi:hypothetical protein
MRDRSRRASERQAAAVARDRLKTGGAGGMQMWRSRKLDVSAGGWRGWHDVAGLALDFGTDGAIGRGIAVCGGGAGEI